jgi:hypothetical protein
MIVKWGEGAVAWSESRCVTGDVANEEIQVSCLPVENYRFGNCSYTRGLVISPFLKTLFSFTSVTCQFFFFYWLFFISFITLWNLKVMEIVLYWRMPFAASCSGVTKLELHPLWPWLFLHVQYDWRRGYSSMFKTISLSFSIYPSPACSV